jgi:hypothetical protein
MRISLFSGQPGRDGAIANPSKNAKNSQPVRKILQLAVARKAWLPNRDPSKPPAAGVLQFICNSVGALARMMR